MEVIGAPVLSLDYLWVKLDAGIGKDTGDGFVVEALFVQFLNEGICRRLNRRGVASRSG
jgi:hypothetical protein